MQGIPQQDDFDGEAAGFSEINITPLTDVFLVLLIIMMVVSSAVVEEEKESAYQRGILAERALQVMTPQGAGQEALAAEDVIISITNDKAIFIDDEEVSLAQLDERLKAIQAGNPLTRIVLRGDEKLSYAIIMDVLRRCGSHGLSNVALASRD